jgi:hypothetical protein
LISSKTKPISEENLAETFVLDIEARLSEWDSGCHDCQCSSHAPKHLSDLRRNPVVLDRLKTLSLILLQDYQERIW